jgi:hypothetical protein
VKPWEGHHQAGPAPQTAEENVMTDIQDPHAEYPKMLFKKGEHPREHQMEGKAIPVAGVSGLTYKTVASYDEEAEALEDGWYRSPLLDKAPASNDPRDKEIERLKAMLSKSDANPERATLKPLKEGGAA